MGTLANYHWQPTTVRIVTVDCYEPAQRGTLQMPAQTLAWPGKNAGDTLDYVIDYSEALAGDCGDTIATLDVVIFPNGPGDVTLSTSDADGNQAVLWMTSGQAGTTYSVTVAVTTTNGRSIVRTIDLPIVSLSVPLTSGDAITDQTGAALTDQANSPLTA